MALDEPIGLFDRVELRESFGAAPIGARGTVIGLLENGEVAEVEITTPNLSGVDRIVYARPSRLRRRS